MRGLNNTEMRQQNSAKVEEDIRYGQSVMLVTTPDDDVKHNKDYSIGGFGIAWRKRRVSLKKWQQVSIRYQRTSGNPTEFQKILAGQCKSQLYIFEFLDCYVVCKLSDIALCLRQKEKHEIIPNPDGKTKGCYIKVKDIPHFLIEKTIRRERA